MHFPRVHAGGHGPCKGSPLLAGGWRGGEATGTLCPLVTTTSAGFAKACGALAAGGRAGVPGEPEERTLTYTTAIASPPPEPPHCTPRRRPFRHPKRAFRGNGVVCASSGAAALLDPAPAAPGSAPAARASSPAQAGGGSSGCPCCERSMGQPAPAVTLEKAAA